MPSVEMYYLVWNALRISFEKMAKTLVLLDTILNLCDNFDRLYGKKDRLDTISKNSKDIFSNENMPKLIYNNIWNYLLSQSPINDGLVLTSKQFRDITYNHNIFSKMYHLMYIPGYKLNKNNKSGFNIGGPKLSDSIIINNINNINIKTFPFKKLKVYYLNKNTTFNELDRIIHIFNPNMKCIMFNDCKFLYSNDIKHSIPILNQCDIFGLRVKGKWSNKLELYNKFKHLTWFEFTLDDTFIEWDNDIFSKLNKFLDYNSKTLSVLKLNFNITSYSKNINNNEIKYNIILPPNIEILSLQCFQFNQSNVIDIDFTKCQHKIKQIVCWYRSFQFLKASILKGIQLKNLQFLVIFDSDLPVLKSINKDKWNNFISNTKIHKLFNPMAQQIIKKWE